MRSNTLILLAVSVFSHLATAAVIRHSPLTRSGNFVRSFNQSSIPVGPHPDSTSDSLAATTLTLATSSPSETNSLPLAQAASVSSVLPSKQVGSVAAVGNGPGAASIASSATTKSLTSTSPPAALPSSTTVEPSHAAGLSSQTDGGPSSAATTKQVGSVPAVGNGPGAASIESSAITNSSTKSLIPDVLSSSATSKPSSATRSSSSAGKASQSPLTTKAANASATSTSFSRLFPLGTGVGSETIHPVAPVTPSRSSLPSAQSSGILAGSLSVASVSSPSQTLIPTITDIPSSTDTPGKNENIIVADRFNSYFDTMNPDSGCNAALNSEATVCINKQLATCGSNRKYTLTPCPQGQECRALPLDNGSRGIYLQCITPSEAAKLSLGRSSSIPSIAAQSTPSQESVTQKTTVQGPSTTALQGSVTLSRQTGKLSSESSLSTGAASLPNIIIPSATKPTSSLEPTTTKITPSSSRSSSSVAVASSTPNNIGSSSSTAPSTTAHKTTEPAPILSIPITLLTSLTSTRPSKDPAPAPEASTPPSAQPSVPSGSEPGISIIPEPRITDKPTANNASPAVINAVVDPVTTSNSFAPDSRVTVRETVTVTTTVHDQR